MNPFYNKKKKGYTLAEVLATVAILLILMAIAVPAIFSIRKNLRQKALDNKAELIYTAVQNNLVKLQNNGNSSLYAAGETEGKVDVTPSDADGEKNLYYVTSNTKTEKAASIILTSDNVDEELYNHYWVIEYNPDSASVYAVFYSEKRSDYTPASYNILRDKDERLAAGAEVGYYGGDVIDGSNTSVLAPKLTITNEEKLVASISCLSPDNKALSFVVTLEDSENHKLTLKYRTDAVRTSLAHESDDLHPVATSGLDSKNEKGSVKGRQYNLEITLDDLSDATTRFAALYGEKNKNLGQKALIAGTELKITVEVKSENRKIEGKSTDITTNSLFADKSSSSNAVIVYGRHLQNLDQASGVVDTIKTAAQESDIHFEEQDDKEGTSSWYSCYGNKTFKPITNTNLTKFAGNKTSTIYHLTVDRTIGKDSDQSPAGAEDSQDNVDLAGLFTALPDTMTVEAVYMSGTSVKGNSSASSCAGAIAGKTTGSATLNDCRVYLDSDDVKDKTDSDVWISGAKMQGGLLGQLNGEVKISDSFAATVMGEKEAQYVGGLVGYATDNTSIAIEKCYTDSYLAGTYTGGLIGAAEGNTQVKAEFCYTAGYQSAGEYAGGFIAKSGRATNNIIKNGYAAVVYVSPENGKSPSIYNIAPAGGESVYYLATGHQGIGAGIGIDYSGLSDRNTMVTKLNPDYFVSSTKTYAYNLRNQGLTSYSYPSLKGMDHYGDWEADYEAGSLVYYEKYGEDENGNAEIGFWGGNVTSTLRGDQVAVGDGYGVVYEKTDAENIDPFIVEYQTGIDKDGNILTERYKVDPSDENTVSYTVTVNSNGIVKTYIVFPLSSDIVNASPISNVYYQKLTIKGISATGNTEAQKTEESTDGSDLLTGKTFYFNPHFAKTVESTDTIPENPKAFTIRTARQLYHLSLYYQDYNFIINSESVFNQELDIDYSDYDWKFAGPDEGKKVSVQEPLGVVKGNAAAFTATYNGRYHEIRGISFETSADAVGFVGENAGTLLNIFLASEWSNALEAVNPYVNYDGDIKNNKTVYMGAMAGINSGRIQNCAVCGYGMGIESVVYVQRNGYLYLGGFAGSNRGMIQNCEVDAPSVNASVLFGTAYLGGFAGENRASATIRNCYAVGDVSIEYAREATSVISGFAANNAGVLRTDYCAVALTAAGTTSSYGFAPKGAGSIRSDCYYLNGGTFQYLGREIAFDNDNQNGGGKSLTYQEMTEKGNQTANSVYHSGTTEEGNYPFAAVVSNGSGRIHYGNWQIPVDLGAIGVIYWELEEGGSNNGYHFSYIGYEGSGTTAQVTQTSGSTLCQQHDDGGKITQYGYGYYYKGTEADANELTVKATNFVTGTKNKNASDALTERLAGFTVVAFRTEPSIKDTADSSIEYMKMTADDRTANGVWDFVYKSQPYTFTINPFFANAMQYGSRTDDGMVQAAGVQTMSLSVVDEYGFTAEAEDVPAMPGSAENEYEIRSDDQLQYMNWNVKTKNAYTALNADNYKANVSGYTYLGYMQTKEYRWKGTDNPQRQQREFSQWNGRYYLLRENTTNYWEFRSDSNSSQSYYIPKWKQKYDSSRREYYYEDEGGSGQKGYWVWHGASDCPTPIDSSGNDETSSRYQVSVNGNAADYSWKQTHDVDADMYHEGGILFTQIGSIYDELGAKHQEAASAYISYFNGSYNGNTYSIKNVEIDSTSTLVGLFGAVVGADVQNVILYSENGNYIQRNADSPRSWYALGGLCGLAAAGTGKDASEAKITNCTVSGYTIRDNSTKSAWGDGNVGGMFGMCTINLEKCTAVNTIDLNCVFPHEKEEAVKSDGVSVRTGGLVGSMRGEITNCYTGGEIVCEQQTLYNAYWGGSGGAKLFLGGITGGIYIKNGGNLLNLLGTDIKGVDLDWASKEDHTSGNNKACTTPTTVIKDCYTYIKLPSSDDTIQWSGKYADDRWANSWMKTYGDCVRSIEPIGSNGETPFENAQNYHVRVRIRNCYYYADENWKSKDFKVGDASSAFGANTNNVDDTAVRIKWKQLAGKETIKVKLNEDNEVIGSAEETTGTGPATGTGGNATDTTNVEEGTLMSLLNRDSESYSYVTTKENGKTVNGKYSFPGNRTYLNGENYPFPAILTQTSLNGKTTARVHYGEWPLEGIYWKDSRATMDIYEDLALDTTDELGNLMAVKDFNLLDEGAVLDKGLTLENGFTVEYSAGEDEGSTEVQTFASEAGTDSEEVFSDGTDETGDSEIAAFTGTNENSSGDEIAPGTRIENREDYIAEITKLAYNPDKGCFVATVKALKTGSTVIKVTAVGSDGNTTYSASFSLTVTANLNVYANPSQITQNVDQTSEVTFYAVPGNLTTSTNSLDFVDGDTAAVADDGSGFTAGSSADMEISDGAEAKEAGIAEESIEPEMSLEEEENISDVGGFEAESTDAAYVDMVPEVQAETGASESDASSESFGDYEQESTDVAVYADEAPEKNLASYMTWSVTVDEEDNGLVTVGNVENGKFTVRSDAPDSSVTLTITGKFTYQNVEYTNICWVEIVTRANGAVCWENNKGTAAVTTIGTGGYSQMEETYKLIVPSGALKDNQLDKSNIVLTGATATDNAVDIAEVKSVTQVSGGYSVVIICKKPGTVNVTVNATGSDGTSITVEPLVLTVSTASAQDSSDNSEPINNTNDEWVDEDSDFTSDTVTGGDDSSDSTVDMVPNQDSDITYDDENGWDSGDSDFQ